MADFDPSVINAPTPTIARMYQHVQDEQKNVESQQTAFDQSQITALDAQRQGTIAADARTSQAYDSMRQAMDQPRPQFKPPEVKPPTLDPKSYETLAMSTLAMALIGGHSSGNWQGAATALDGLGKGLIQGNQMQVEQYWKEYEAKYKAASDEYRAGLADLQQTLDSKQLTINEMLFKGKALAAQYQHDDVHAALVQKQLDRAHEQVQARLMAVDKAAEHFDETKARLEEMRDYHARATGANGGAGLTENQKRYLIDGARAGRPEETVRSAVGYSKAGREEAFRVLADAHAAGEITFEQMAQARKDVDAAGAADRQIESRKVMIKALTGEIQDLQPRVEALLKKVNPSGIPIANMTINAFKDRFIGPQDLTEYTQLLQAIGRIHQKVVTGALSNAQMHVQFANTADQNLNRNMNAEQVFGSLKATNEEIVAAEKGLGAAQGQAQQDIRDAASGRGAGSTAAPQGASESKTLNGVTYHKVNGQWMQE